jgi:hypothetical protein
LAQTRYANFNALTVTGRIYNAEIATNKAGEEFLAVSVISTATKDGEDIVYTFNDSQGLMKLHLSGYFCKGREVTITGHVAGVRTAYKTSTGQVKLLKRPELRLQSVCVLDGGLGRMPQSESAANLGGMTITVDETPTLQDSDVKDLVF